METFNIWDLERVHIKITENFLKTINSLIFKNYKTKRELYNKVIIGKEIPFNSFKNLLKNSYLKNNFVPLEIYIKIIESINILKEELQENIVAYKTAGGINYIIKPTLPIKITPVFDMIFAHNIGDGTVINPKKGRLPYFGYRQFNKFYRIAYIKKIESIFGKIQFKEDYFENSTRPYCPPVISTLFFKYYNLRIEDFLSEKSRIPKLIFDKGEDSLLAVLIAFIIDEGHIESTQIIIGLKNTKLIQDLGKICDVLGYKYQIKNGKGYYKDYSRLYISREGMKKLYTNYLVLNKKYSVINLGIKGEKIKNSFKIYDRKIYKTEGNRQILLEILKNEQLSVNQLAERLNMTRQGVRFHVHKLLKEGKIKLIDNTKLNWMYGV